MVRNARPGLVFNQAACVIILRKWQAWDRASEYILVDIKGCEIVQLLQVCRDASPQVAAVQISVKRRGIRR